MKVRLAITIILLMSILGCRAAEQPEATTATQETQGALEVVPDIEQRRSQLPRTVIDYDRNLLDSREQQALAKLIEASRYMDAIFYRQVSERNPAWHEQLLAAGSSPALAYFENMKGPWDRLKENEPFLSVGPKPAGAGFYPEDLTKEELEAWIAANPGDKESFQGLFTVIRREGDRLVAIPYSTYYKEHLDPAGKLLTEAAALTGNASLRNYLTKLVASFSSNDYFESDLAWMDLDSDLEVIIGPYEVYEDNLFNYKASFESFITVVDKPETEKLALYSSHMPAMERNLPIPDEHKNPNRGTDSPIRVVQEVFTAGDARRGVQTAAFNLPNDEKVREAKGSKMVLLKNVMEAKFRQSGQPIAARVLDSSQIDLVTFDAFFNHVLFHELSHGVGPGLITAPDGKRVETRLLLQNLYSTIEEAKADVLSLWNLMYAMDEGLVTAFDRETMFATNAGVMYRSLRFGIDSAHGRGNAIQWNWFREKGGIVPAGDGRFRVDFARMEEATRSLANELLMIEATGDFARAERLVNKYGIASPEMKEVIARLEDIPVDIEPVFAGAGETP
ncbi:MAG TPA: peptidase [Thermoanaerobaculia bacterium]|nr:peptidase [Thermoanaerobaculia bacterium]